MRLNRASYYLPQDVYPQLSAPGVHTCSVHSCCRHSAGRLIEPGSLNSHYQQLLCELESHSECRKVADACSKSLVFVAAEFGIPCKSFISVFSFIYPVVLQAGLAHIIFHRYRWDR